MYVWMIWVRDADATWIKCEAAWDEGMIAENEAGWHDEQERVRKLCFEANYEMRLQRVRVPGVKALFEAPTVDADAVGAGDDPSLSTGDKGS